MVYLTSLHENYHFHVLPKKHVMFEAEASSNTVNSCVEPWATHLNRFTEAQLFRNLRHLPQLRGVELTSGVWWFGYRWNQPIWGVEAHHGCHGRWMEVLCFQGVSTYKRYIIQPKTIKTTWNPKSGTFRFHVSYFGGCFFFTENSSQTFGCKF